VAVSAAAVTVLLCLLAALTELPAALREREAAAPQSDLWAGEARTGPVPGREAEEAARGRAARAAMDGSSRIGVREREGGGERRGMYLLLGCLWGGGGVGVGPAARPVRKSPRGERERGRRGCIWGLVWDLLRVRSANLVGVESGPWPAR
jgi:hypothetical protein